MGWQDISTAPKDGTSVLMAWSAIAIPEDGPRWFQTVGWWDDRFECYAEKAGEFLYRSAWTDGQVGSYGEARELEPTHWMPLPAPPLPTEKEG